MIVSSCEDESVVLDMFGGAGTTALVALQLGYRAITIEINPDYTSEARERLADAPAIFRTETVGQKKSSTSGRTSSIAINVPAEPDGGNIVDLMAAKKSLGQEASLKKAAPQLPAPEKPKRAAAAAHAAKSGRKRA
jgi:DNA methylase